MHSIRNIHIAHAGILCAFCFAFGRMSVATLLHNQCQPIALVSSTTGAAVHAPSSRCYAQKMCPSVLRGSWFSANHSEFYGEFGGDETRYSFHTYLSPNSFVVEVGGHTGVDIKKMTELHGSFKTLLFEPIFYDEARKNLEGLDVEVYPYGLGASTRSATFGINGDGTKLLKDKRKNGKVAQIRQFSVVIDELRISRIDLLQINCEGCEWELLESLLNDEQTHIFQHIQVQFHPGVDWVEDQLTRYAAIQDRLTKTHELLYDQPWIWQLWQLKSFPP